MRQLVPWLSLAPLVLAGCEPEPLTPCEEAALEGALCHVGTGATAWEEVADGDVVEFVRGPQGGLHVYGSLQVGGILQGQTDEISDPDNPSVTYEVVDAGTVIGGYQGLPRHFVEQDDGTMIFVGDLLVLYTQDPEEVEGKTVEMRAEVVDKCGRSVTDAHTVTLTLGGEG